MSSPPVIPKSVDNSNSQKIDSSTIKSKGKPTLPSEDTVFPNPRDPDCFCEPCGVTFEEQSLFLEHLQQNHKSQYEIPQIKSRDLICRVCFVKYKNKVRYRRHLIKVHNVKTSKISKNKSYCD